MSKGCVILTEEIHDRAGPLRQAASQCNVVIASGFASGFASGSKLPRST